MDKKYQCNLCNLYKDTSEFYTNSYIKRGFEYSCKNCVKEKKRKNNSTFGNRKRNINFRYKQYGLSEEQYQIMRVSQNFRCMVCGKHESEIPKKVLNVDHNHKTGKVRGLLCTNCNVTLGLIEESKDRLLKLIEYLGKFE